jgi:hypothetical protein
MITFEGLLVPSITIVLPFGGAELSGVVMLMLVGSVLYGVSAAAAALVDDDPPPDDAVAVLEPLDPDDAGAAEELVDELDEPQAASATASTSIPMMTTKPRVRSRPPLRRSWFVMCVSFPM